MIGAWSEEVASLKDAMCYPNTTVLFPSASFQNFHRSDLNRWAHRVFAPDRRLQHDPQYANLPQSNNTTLPNLPRPLSTQGPCTSLTPIFRSINKTTERNGGSTRYACIASGDMVASISFASTAMRCADAMRCWRVTIGSPMALMEIGKALACCFGTSCHLFGHPDGHSY
jgi:hypothetical protein